MKFLNSLIVLTFFSLVGSAAGADGVVIGNANVTLSQAEIKDVFLGEKQTAGSVKLVLVDNKAVQAEFLSKVLGMDQVKYSSQWAKKSFQDGLAAPKAKGSDADVVEFVKSTPGGVGYVSSAPAGVNVLGKF